MLKCPFMNTPYIPNISHIIGALSIYDLESTVGKELWKYDPNNEKDREKIIICTTASSWQILTEIYNLCFFF